MSVFNKELLTYLLFSPVSSLVSSWCDHSMLVFLFLTVSTNSLFTPALLKALHSFVFFAVREISKVFLRPFISKASRCDSSFFLVSSYHSRTLLQAILALSLVVSMLKMVRCDFSIFSAVMPRSSVLYLTWYGILSYAYHLL